MKKLFVVLVLLCSVAFAGAQGGPVCTDLPANLSRGAESANVLKLQNFLYAKGYLKATPNGYFGPGTHAAVRQYQMINRLSSVGSAGPLTRAAIKKESCKVAPEQAFAQAFAQAAQAYASSTLAATTSTSAPPSALPARPVINSVDLVSLFENGETDWAFNLYGSNFQKGIANGVFMKNTSTGVTYNIGAFASPDGITLTLPKNLTATAFPCGINCKERLSAGKYELSVFVFGAMPSDPVNVEVKSFSMWSQTGSLASSLPASGGNLKFGQVSFSASSGVLVKAISLVTGTSTISPNGISSVVIKDDLKGSTFAPDTLLSPYQSMIATAYVSTSNTSVGGIYGHFIVEIEDYIGKKRTKFTSPSFLVSVAGVL